MPPARRCDCLWACTGWMLDLAETDEASLCGDFGCGVAFAVRIVEGAAQTMGATRLLDITSAHVDLCIFNGISGGWT